MSLAALIYTQHANTVIVERDMKTVAALGSIAARFDHEDGDLAKLMVDKAAGGTKVSVSPRVAVITANLRAIHSDLVRVRRDLPPSEQQRTGEIIRQIDTYTDAVSVVGSMLDVDFASSVTMLVPFKRNAQHVVNDVTLLVASGIADAREHAKLAASRTKLLVAGVSAAMILVAVLSLAWLLLATRRAMILRSEMQLRADAEDNALALAQHDSLTGLFNRRVFVDQLVAAISSNSHTDVRFAVAIIDLDRFKEANDSYGHAAGDAILRTMAVRMRALLGANVTLARFGGDEFAALIPYDISAAALVGPMERLAIKLREPTTWQEVVLSVGASIGVSLYPTDAQTPDALLHTADMAMYRAKREKSSTFQFFDASMETERVERRRRKLELQSGIPLGEIVPYYQPVVDLATRDLRGYEILARWNHPRLGLLPPGEFIEIAENTGQITKLTESVLRQACSDICKLPAHLRFAINVSPIQLIEPGLAPNLISIVRNAGLPPSRFEIEFTEDAVLGDTAVAELVIDQFRRAGMTVALDDFGTGFSSLSNLRRLKFDKIKIDRSFVDTMLISSESEKLVDTILHLAQSFSLSVTAEGIEDEAVALALTTKGCALGQGYLFGKPMPSSKIIDCTMTQMIAA